MFVLALIGMSICSMIMALQPIGRSSAQSAVHNGTAANVDRPLLYLLLTTRTKSEITYLEYAVTFLLALEVFCRFIVSKTKGRFFKNALNITDVINIIIPVSLYIVTMLSPKEQKEVNIDPDANLLTYLPSGWQAIYLLKSLTILRIFRVCRIVQHVKLLHIMALTIRHSWREFSLIFGLLGIAALLFGCLLFFAEIMENNIVHFGHTLWWALITMTTVGYGDFYPVTTQGYIVGALCSVCGILILSMPIPIIVSNFDKYYNYWNICERMQAKKKQKCSPESSHCAKVSPLASPHHSVKVSAVGNNQPKQQRSNFKEFL
jgi:hypothetical protein